MSKNPNTGPGGRPDPGRALNGFGQLLCVIGLLIVAAVCGAWQGWWSL